MNPISIGDCTIVFIHIFLIKNIIAVFTEIGRVGNVDEDKIFSHVVNRFIIYLIIHWCKRYYPWIYWI